MWIQAELNQFCSLCVHHECLNREDALLCKAPTFRQAQHVRHGDSGCLLALSAVPHRHLFTWENVFSVKWTAWQPLSAMAAFCSSSAPPLELHDSGRLIQSLQCLFEVGLGWSREQGMQSVQVSHVSDQSPYVASQGMCDHGAVDPTTGFSKWVMNTFRV